MPADALEGPRIRQGESRLRRSHPLAQRQRHLDRARHRHEGRSILWSIHFRDEWRVVFFPKAYQARRSHDETCRQFRMLHLSDMDESRYPRSHHSIALIRIIPLPGIVGQRDPVSMLTDDRKKVDVPRICRKVSRVSFDPVASGLQGIGNTFAEVAIGEERELMLRIRMRELLSARQEGVRNLPSRRLRNHQH